MKHSRVVVSLWLLSLLLVSNGANITSETMEIEEPGQEYEIFYNESSYIPGGKPDFRGQRPHISWFRLNRPTCTKIPFNSDKAIHPLYALTIANNTAMLVGMLTYPSVYSGFILNTTKKMVEPYILTSTDSGLNWDCTIVNDTETMKTTDIFRQGAAITTYIYPPPPVGINTPQIELQTPSLTKDNTIIQCNMLCVMGGLRGISGNYDSEFTNMVTCSKDNGNTWFYAAALPTVIVRGTAIQFNEELLIIGGQRADSSAHILSAQWDYATCNITGWIEYAPASPMTDRFDISATTLWNNDTKQMELWAGGGKTMAGGSPLRALDLWKTSTPNDRSSWVRAEGMLPISSSTLGNTDEGRSDFSVLTTFKGIPWGLQHGECDPTANPEVENNKICYTSIFLLNSDLTYIYVPDVTNGWASYDDNYLYTNAGVFTIAAPVHRRSIFLYDNDHDGRPISLTFDLTGGVMWRVDTTPCYDICPKGMWTPSCRLSPFDATCRPCSRCRSGFYSYNPCGSSKDTFCKPCSSCEPGEVILSPCTPENNTVCGLDSASRLDTNTIVVNTGKLFSVYSAILSSVIFLALSVAIAPLVFRGKLNENIYNDSFTLNTTTITIVDNKKPSVPSTSRSISSSSPSSSSSSIISIPNNENSSGKNITNSINGSGTFNSMFRNYVTSVFRYLRIIWPVLGTLTHYVCYATLASALWYAPKLDSVTNVLVICLISGPIVNSFCLWYTTQSSIISNGIPVHVWKPITVQSWVAVLLSILHPRVMLSLLPSPNISRRGLHPDILPPKRYIQTLYWIMISSIIQDIPPVMGCLIILGAISLPSAAPAMLMCVALGIANLFGTFAWTMSSFIRSGMLSKFSSNHAQPYQADSIGEIVSIEDTIIPEHSNTSTNNIRLNPIPAPHYSNTTISQPHQNRDSSPVRRSMINPGNNMISNSNGTLSLSSTTSLNSISIAMEKQEMMVESLRHKLATQQPISEKETAEAAMLVTGLQGKAAELLKILATVVQQSEINNNNINNNGNDDNQSVHTFSDADSIGNPGRSTTRTSGDTIISRNPLSNRSNLETTIPASTTSNNLGNFFVGIGTTQTNEQPYLDRVITELTAPIEVEDTLPLSHSPVSADSVSIRPNTNDEGYNVGHPNEDVRSRSTSISITSEIGNVPNHQSVIISPSRTSNNPLPTRISRVVRSLTPGNPINHTSM